MNVEPRGSRRCSAEVGKVEVSKQVDCDGDTNVTGAFKFRRDRLSPRPIAATAAKTERDLSDTAGNVAAHCNA